MAQTNTSLNNRIIPTVGTAIVAQVPDNAITGGNTRGTNAIDLQTARTAATQVASGANSIVIGVNNSSSGESCFSIGNSSQSSGLNSFSLGVSASSSGSYSLALGRFALSNGEASLAIGNYANATSNASIAIGGLPSDFLIPSLNCVASGHSSIAIGFATKSTNISSICIGNSSTSSGDSSIAIGIDSTANASSAVALGNSNTASGIDSSVLGGRLGTTNSITGQVAFPHSSADGVGVYQTTLTGLRQSTTGSTPVRATADAATASATNQLTLRNNSAYIVEGSVVARDTVTNDAASFTFSVLIKRGAAAANTSIVGTPMISQDFADTAAATWGVSLVADATNGALGVNVQGAGTNAIRWMIELYAQEVN